MEYGIIVLLPPIVTVVLALITKKAWEPLIAGGTLAFIISDGLNFFGPWMDGWYTVFDGDGVWLMLCVGFIGVFGILLEESKGAYGIGKLISKLAKTEKRSLFVAWIIGILMFIDDYSNALTVTSAMKPVTDPLKIPREKLAYVTNSTAAPVCILVPLSSWYVFFGGLINKEEAIKGTGLGDGFDIYIGSIPYMFYGWVALLIVPLVILGIIPNIGKMKAAYKRVAETGDVFSKASQKYNLITAEEAVKTKDGKALNFIVPMAVVIAGTLYTGDLLIGLIWSTVAAGILYMVNKTMTFYEWVECLYKGWADMAQMFFVMMTAIFVKVAFDNIGLAEYVVNHVAPLLSSETFPVIVFIVVSALAFCTGNNWGVPAITIPMVAPLAVACDANIFMAMGALLSGAAFGSHACFFSDTTILTAKCSGISNMEHALSQIPYAATAAIISIILFIAVGYLG